MTPVVEEARRLLSLAKADRDAFLWLLQGAGLRPAAAYFFAQQSIEKSLKSVMIFSNLVPSRTHNLLALAAELNSVGLMTPYTPDELAILNPYAVTLRYDDEELALTSPDQACSMVEDILIWTEQRILA